MIMADGDVVKYTRGSVVSVALTAVAITVNHTYALGRGALVLGSGVFVVSAALWWWFTKTRSRAALAGYLLMNLWIVAGFGLFKGYWNTLLRLFAGTFAASISTAFPRPVIGTLAFEMSGVLMFIGSLFVLYFAYRIVEYEYRLSHHGRWVFVTYATVILLLTAAYGQTDRDTWVEPPGGVVRIGVIVPTEGPYSMLGNSFVKAVEMAIADLKHTTYRYELVIRDSGPDPVAARHVIQEVVERENLQAIVGGISLIGQVTKPYATRARIPHTCVCTVTSIADGAYNFTNIPTPEAEAAAWVREAQQRSVKRAAVIWQNYPSINNHVRALMSEAGRQGIVVSYQNRFDGQTREFQSTIAQAAASRPDVFYVEALEPALDLLGQQLQDANIGMVSSIVAPSLSRRPDLFEGAWYTDSDLRDVEFKTRFEKAYPGTQFATHMMPYAYDSVNMIVQAFEHRQNPAVYLRNLTTYEGTADTLTKARGSGIFVSTPAVWIIRNGKPTLQRMYAAAGE
jgi:ABC-type branched-subunit amino acid transport system substrate-binding protein